MNRLETLIADIEPEIIALRRDLHRHPELSFQEKRTAGIVARKLRSLGIPTRENVARTGVVGLLNPRKTGKTIAIRADMDAIEGNEEIEKDYRSGIPGVQHGCGHDAHVAMALGTAMVLSEIKDQLKGNVAFLFEPAEEVITENDLTVGSALMIEEGALTDVDALLYLHVWPESPTNTITLSKDIVFSGWDMLTVRVIGKEHHGGTPEKGVDAIAVASHLVCALQTLMSRCLSITEPCSVHIGTVNGGRARNMVADCVELTGSVRCANMDLRREALPKAIENVVRGITSSFGARYEMQYTDYLHPVVNDGNLAEIVANAIGENLGKHAVCWTNRPWMGGDSFYRYSEQVPCCYGLLGSGNPKLDTCYQTHHPLFDIDEACMKAGIHAYCSCVLKYLNESVTQS